MRVRLALIPLVAGAALLAGCATGTPTTTTTTPAGNGVAALSADEILAKAQAAFKAAKSVHIKGEFSEPAATGATPTPSTTPAAPMKASIDATVAGKDYTGTFTTSGFTVQISRIGNDVYLKAPDAMWASIVPAGLQSTIALLKGKWVKFDANSPLLAGFSDFTDPSALLSNDNGFTKGEVGTVDGKPAIALIDKKDSSNLWVSTEGEPVPLKREDASGPNALSFTDYNKDVTLTPPPAAEVFDIKALMGG
jgi:hypothetical protein